MFKPINKHLIVKVVVVEEVLESGIIMPDTIEKVVNDGVVIHEVVAVDESGDWLKVGDFVAYANWSGTKYEEDGVDYVVLREADLYGVRNG